MFTHLNDYNVSLICLSSHLVWEGVSAISLCEGADTPFYIQGDDMFKANCYTLELFNLSGQAETAHKGWL